MASHKKNSKGYHKGSRRNPKLAQGEELHVERHSKKSNKSQNYMHTKQICTNPDPPPHSGQVEIITLKIIMYMCFYYQSYSFMMSLSVSFSFSLYIYILSREIHFSLSLHKYTLAAQGPGQAGGKACGPGRHITGRADGDI